jgi:hypothetical protein
LDRDGGGLDQGAEVAFGFTEALAALEMLEGDRGQAPDGEIEHARFLEEARIIVRLRHAAEERFGQRRLRGRRAIFCFRFFGGAREGAQAGEDDFDAFGAERIAGQGKAFSQLLP